MNLIEIKRGTANFCVICPSGFANVGDFTFFESEDDAKAFAEENSGRVVDEAGLAEKYEAMHCAEGRDPRNDSHGRCIENPDDAQEIWEAQYAEDAAESFHDATVYAIEVVEKHSKLYVKIYAGNKAGNTNNFDVTVETEAGDVLKRGDESDHAEFIAWAKTQSEKVEYDT